MQKNIILFAYIITIGLIDFGLLILNERHNLGYSPTQTISFSHKQHLGKYNITCMFCHYDSETNKYISTPTIHNCMNCHVALKTESKMLEKLVRSYDEGISLKHKKVFDLPDYVQFSHKKHIQTGIDCSTCHDSIESLDSLYLTKKFTMAWCIDCHKNPTKYAIPPKTISGIFYDTTALTLSVSANSSINTANKHYLASPITTKPLKPASIECSTCHY